MISTQVLQEFYVTATRKLRLAPPAARRALEDLAMSCRTVAVEAPAILAAAGRSERQRLSFWDALLLETALVSGCELV